MNRIEIEECNDIETLRRLCIRQHSAILRIGETLVDNSKSHLTDKRTLEEISDILRLSEIDICRNCMYYRADSSRCYGQKNTPIVNSNGYCSDFKLF